MAKMKPRADGRYQGKILIGVIDGKQKYRYVYGKTQKEVKDKIAALRVELGKGADLTQPMDLAFWIDRWLARTEQTQTEEWHDICTVRAEYWKQCLGRVEIDKLTTADLEDVLLSLAKRNPKTGKPSGRKTLTEYASVIRRVFALAVQNRVLTFDPSIYLTVTKEAPKSRRTALTDAQIAAIHATPHECRLPCLMMIYAGLRFGELAALTWSDVDLQNGTVSVTKSYNFKSCSFKTPKTAAGERVVPIPALLLDELKAAPRASLFVCPHNGKMWTQGAWQNQFDGYLKRLGFSTTAHCLRHTYATILYEAGIDVLTAQYFMGHADSQTTMNIYTHLREAKKAASIAKLDAYLSPEKQNGVNAVSE